MANANSNTQFSVHDVDQINEYLREMESTAWMLLSVDTDIPQEHIHVIAHGLYLRAGSVATLVEHLWDAYRETSNKLAAATQLIAKAHKEDHHD